MNLSQAIDYANHVEVSEKVTKWLNTTLKNYLEKNQVETEEVEHVIDYLKMNEVVKIDQMSYPQAVKKAEKWNVSLQKKAEKITELPEDTKLIHDFKDGFKIVQLVGKNAYEREGYLMRHCVASYYGNGTTIYSLRDAQNNPHCTMEEGQQVKGKGNGDIHPKYVGYVVKFLEKIGMTVGDSEMKHLGYINVKQFKKYLHKDTKYFNKSYVPKNEVLLDKDGKEFASLDLWDVKPLIQEKDESIEIAFNLSTFLSASFDFLLKYKKKTKDVKNSTSRGNYSTAASSGYYSTAASSGYSSTAASSGNSSTAASSGDSSKAASSGYYSTAASSGYSSTAASSGDSSTAASSGDSSTAASSGYYSTAASSGYSSTAASSGDSSKAASSGNSSTAASSGNSSTAASSGYSSTAASSGDSSKAASSGNYSKAEVNGEESIAAAIGSNTMARASLGSWIVVSEYYKDGNKWRVRTVKSAKIDGKKLKENTWYKVVNSRWVEVK